MEISVIIRCQTLVVSLSGELDHHSAKELKNMIEELIKNRSVKNLIFDFSNLSFMDSSGIGVVLGRYKLISSIGGKTAIVSCNRTIDRLLMMSGINKLIETHENLDDAFFSILGGVS